MGLVVALLRVTDPRPTVDPLSGAVRSDDRSATLSDQDAAALEQALRAGEVLGCPVLAIAAGGVEVEPALRSALALGCVVLRVPLPMGVSTDVFVDEQALAAALVAGMGEHTPTLVVCGDRSADRGTGALPAFVAAVLGVSQALGLVALAVTKTSVRAERRLDGGRREMLEIALPAVVSVEAAGMRLRRAPLSAAVAATAAAVPVAASVISGSPVEVRRVRAFTPRTRELAPPQPGPPRVRLLELTGALTAHEPPTIVGPVQASEAADVLLEFLRRHGYLEPSS